MEKSRYETGATPLEKQQPRSIGEQQLLPCLRNTLI